MAMASLVSPIKRKLAAETLVTVPDWEDAKVEQDCVRTIVLRVRISSGGESSRDQDSAIKEQRCLMQSTRRVEGAGQAPRPGGRVGRFPCC